MLKADLIKRIKHLKLFSGDTLKVEELSYTPTWCVKDLPSPTGLPVRASKTRMTVRRRETELNNNNNNSILY